MAGLLDDTLVPEGGGFVLDIVPRGGGFVGAGPLAVTLLSADFHSPNIQALPTTAEALAAALGGSS